MASLDVDLEALTRRVFGESICWDLFTYCLITCDKLNMAGYGICSIWFWCVIGRG